MKKSIGYDLLKGVQAGDTLTNKWIVATNIMVNDDTGKTRFLLNGYASAEASEIHPATSNK